MRSELRKLGKLIRSMDDSFVRNFSTEKAPSTSRIEQDLASIKSQDPKKVNFDYLAKEIGKLSVETARRQTLDGKRTPYKFASDTGSVIDDTVMAKKIRNSLWMHVLGPNPILIEQAKNAVKKLFVGESWLTQKDEEAAMDKMTVTFTSSSTQANKILIGCIGNVNSANGEIALASPHSHIFGFEIGQSAEKVNLTDKVTGKMTVDDLKRADEKYNALGKRTKVIHIDQPTNGDFFYSEKELKQITEWAHSRGIPVTMDIERLVNYLPKIGADYHQFTVGCGIDAVTLGMQKNGGARSSTTIILDRTYLDTPSKIDQRLEAYLKVIGDVSDNKIFISSGWEDMIADKRYLTNANSANEKASLLADLISGMKLKPADNPNLREAVKIQNNPLTTNMIFAKLPRDFVMIFNRLCLDNHHPYRLIPDRYNTTRIVTSYDIPEAEITSFGKLLTEAYLKYHERQPAVEDTTLASAPQEPRTLPELTEILKALMEKTKEAILEQSKGTTMINRKFTHPERPVSEDVLIRMFENNATGYHAPYGDDEVSQESRAILRQLFATDDLPVVFTSSKHQSITCVMQYLKSTDHSNILVSANSYTEHCKYGRPIKALELSGEFEKTDKLDPKGVDALLSFHNSNNGKHVPLLTGVMIEQPTSKGYVYTPQEIKDIVVVAKKHLVPVVLQTSAFTYHLAKTNGTYKEYSTDCGVDVCTIGMSGVGGGPSSAIVVLNPTFLPYDNPEHLSVMLNRTVKENGGKQSDSATLAAGWKEVLENDKWHVNAKKVVGNIKKIFDEIKNYEFDGKPIEFLNDDPAHNVISAKLPDKFLKILNKRGYEFKFDHQGYIRCQVPYNLRDEEVDKFVGDFKAAHQEYQLKAKTPNPVPNKTVASTLTSEKNMSKQ